MKKLVPIISLVFCFIAVSVFSSSAVTVDDLPDDYKDMSVLNIVNSSQSKFGVTATINNNSVHVTGTNDTTIFFTFNIDEITLNGQHYYVIVNCDNLDIQGYLSFGTTDSRVMFFEDGLYPVDFSTDTVVNKFVVRVLPGTHDFSFDFSVVSDEILESSEPTTEPVTSEESTTAEPTTEPVTAPPSEPVQSNNDFFKFLIFTIGIIPGVMIGKAFSFWKW